MKARQRAGLLGGTLATLAALFGCNALVGVEDVRLRSKRDASTGGGEVLTEDGAVARPNVLQVALGDKHSCARKTDGTVLCWGQNLQGQVGAGPGDGGTVTVPEIVPGISDAVDIAAGANHVCVVHQTGTLSCWGNNVDGQLGNGESGSVHDTPVEVSGVTDAVAVAAGGNFACALRRGGTVRCWGGNGVGQLGIGNTNDTTTPLEIPALAGVVAIAAGESHACAVLGSGAMMCWGEGTNGQLGNGQTKAVTRPVSVGSITDAVQVTAGSRSSCARTAGGNVLCWGANEVGQLGTGAANALPNPAPILVANLSDAIAVGSGANHTCAARSSGTVVCWGAASRGQLGAAVDAGSSSRVATALGIAGAVSVAGGGLHSCAGTASGVVSCWGANELGQVGDGTTTTATVPVAVVSGFP